MQRKNLSEFQMRFMNRLEMFQLRNLQLGDFVSKISFKSDRSLPKGSRWEAVTRRLCDKVVRISQFKKACLRMKNYKIQVRYFSKIRKLHLNKLISNSLWKEKNKHSLAQLNRKIVAYLWIRLIYCLVIHQGIPLHHNQKLNLPHKTGVGVRT